MEKIWLKSYQSGVPADINPDKYVSLTELFAESFSKYKGLPAFTNMGETISYSTLEEHSRCFAAFLQNKLQLPKGERFAIMMPNLLQYPIAMLGILRAGCVVVNVNPLYTPDELQHQLNDAQAVGIIVLENFAHTVADVLANTTVKHVIVTRVSDVLPAPKSFFVNIVVKYFKRMVPSWKIKSYLWYNDVLKIGSTTTLNDQKLTGKDIAFLQYTGGTTGRPKGAILTHRNIIANLEQISAWAEQNLTERQEINVTALPLYHIFSLTGNCITFMHFGGLQILITNPRDTTGLIKELKKFKFTTMNGVNTLFNAMLNNPLINTVDFSTLKLALAGGMAVQKVVSERWQQLTKNILIEAYGLTETSPGVCINPFNLDHYSGSVGLPLPSTEISVRDDQNRELDIGESGELWVRGPQVMRGYWNQPKETDLVLTPDGWLRTGDVVMVDVDGYVRIVDRQKDIINVSGFKVYPNEIEDVLAAMPGILEVAVVGAPDENSGEMVKAYIVKKDQAITEQDVISYCHQHLTGYKIPKIVEFRGSLPKSNIGKILRRALR
jgi:long-chain acyl-CoA synthetase